MPTAGAAIGTGMPIPIDGGGTLTFMSQDTSTKDIAEQERERLEAELADLSSQELRISVAEAALLRKPAKVSFERCACA